MAPATSRLLPSTMAATATGSRPLHSEGVATVGTTQHSRGTVWSDEMWGAVTLFLHQSLGEVADPYGGPPVRLLPEVVSTDGDQVLFILQSPHGAIPNDYLVWSVNGARDPVRLPRLPEVLLRGSLGLLDSGNGSFLAAHLSVIPNQNTGWITQGSLHLWKYNPSSSLASPKDEPWTHESVTLPLRNCRNWHNNRVISFNGTDLMFVDFKQGILRMILSDDKPPRFHFVGLPKNLPRIVTNPWRNDRPDMFRSVGCCSGKLKFINLHSHLDDTNNVKVSIWTLNLKNRQWSQDYNNVSLTCRKLWADFWSTHTSLLPPWPNSVPISPFLREDNSNILCLTVVEEINRKAWLLQIDMRTRTLKDVTEYPRYYSHMKQPFLINSSSITPKRKMILWPLPLFGSMLKGYNF